MIKVGDKPILLRIMKHYAKYGFRDFFIALGYRGEIIKKFFNKNFYDWNINLIETGKSTMTGGRLKRPVIYPNLEGIKEVLGDAVLYIDPLNPENIAKGILEITENKNLSEQLIKKGNEKIQEIINKEEFKEIIKTIDNYFNIKTLWEK